MSPVLREILFVWLDGGYLEVVQWYMFSPLSVEDILKNEWGREIYLENGFKISWWKFEEWPTSVAHNGMTIKSHKNHIKF